MHCSVRQYRTRPDELDEILRLVDDELAERLSHEPGFVEYHVIASANGEACTVTVFEDEGGARRSSELAAKFTRETLTGFDVTPAGVVTGQLRISRVRPELLGPISA
jgi:hypothetical protein